MTDADSFELPDGRVTIYSEAFEELANCVRAGDEAYQNYHAPLSDYMRGRRDVLREIGGILSSKKIS